VNQGRRCEPALAASCAAAAITLPREPRMPRRRSLQAERDTVRNLVKASVGVSAWIRRQTVGQNRYQLFRTLLEWLANG
jgi:hypothetical protein